MPVSLDRLIAEREAGIVTDELIRECIVVTTTCPELAEDKKREIAFEQVEAAAFSFKNLSRISNLWGLDKLCKLQLDNNRIEKIENLGHLTNLTWLDLSFNRITAIEGLEQLTKLQDLSLFNNQISSLQGLDTLQNLNVLSIGKNCLSQLTATSYLVRFTKLELLNMAGNPLCQDPDYKSYVLSHLKHLLYLDYRRVQPEHRIAAMEQHQDEMQELHEQEETAATEAAAAAQKAAHAAAMEAANLDGVETLLEDTIAADPEWAKLAGVPQFMDTGPATWADVQTQWQSATDEFKLEILEAHKRKQAEEADFKAALAAALAERDAEGRSLIAAYNKVHKHVMRSGTDDPAVTEEQVLSAKVKLMSLQESLLELEVDTVEVVAALVTEFDRTYSEMAEQNKGRYNEYFNKIREKRNNFFSNVTSNASQFLERYITPERAPELETLPEEVQMMLGDKDALLNAIQTSQEVHTARLDALEDRLVGKEVSSANALADKNNEWQEQRHRDRMSEVLSYLERNMQDLDGLAADMADAAEEAADAQAG